MKGKGGRSWGSGLSSLRFCCRLRPAREFTLVLGVMSLTMYLSSYYFEPPASSFSSSSLSSSSSSMSSSAPGFVPWKPLGDDETKNPPSPYAGDHLPSSHRGLMDSDPIGSTTTSLDVSGLPIDLRKLIDSQVPLPDCSDDPQTLPFAQSIDVHPSVQLVPSFSPFITTYRAKVPFHQLLVSVSAKALNCQSEVRLDGKFGPSRPSNYSLGVGMNKIRLVVVDISHTQPWVINVYTLTIERVSIHKNERKFNPNSRHEVCSLKQDCDLRVFTRDSCGLVRETSTLPSSPFSLPFTAPGSVTWEGFLLSTSSLPPCDTGSASGRWVLPCGSCRDESSCFWTQAVWQPFECRHQVLTRDLVTQCLSNKKLLFIGDSTNRGIMHYMMERVNGTLSESDKTHDLKMYPDLNFGKTLFSFTYYPKFWLPTFQRPSFDQSFLQLLQRLEPISNDSNTVIVFGGVQWLANQHINMLQRALSKKGLQGVKLVMKTLSAGFHQPIEGVLSLPLEDQQNLPSHNMAVSSFAASKGIEVIDTFNITIARYKEFYPGKCACHFHSIKEFSSSSSPPRSNRFHVEGSINSVYSEILLTRICS